MKSERNRNSHRCSSFRIWILVKPGNLSLSWQCEILRRLWNQWKLRTELAVSLLETEWWKRGCALEARAPPYLPDSPGNPSVWLLFKKGSSGHCSQSFVSMAAWHFLREHPVDNGGDHLAFPKCSPWATALLWGLCGLHGAPKRPWAKRHQVQVHSH